MKTSTTSVLLVLAAASVSAAMTLQVSAQTYNQETKPAITNPPQEIKFKGRISAAST